MIIEYYLIIDMKIELKNVQLDKDESREIAESENFKVGKSYVWNHDYNPWLFSNNPFAIVLNDHFIPLIIEDHWILKSKRLYRI